MTYKAYTFNILQNEYWRGGAALDGPDLPFTADSTFERNLDPNSTYNQAAPLLLSSKGRYIWSDTGFNFAVKNGVITVKARGEVKLCDGFKNLRGAYLAAAKKHFPPTGVAPPSEFFTKPQFNTWIEFTYYQAQDKILDYAKSLVKNGYECGVFMIDAGWQEYNGDWTFNRRFPDPKAFIDQLHGLGFKVMLWSCPFVTSDTVNYRILRDKGFLVKNKDGEPSIKHWWDGYSAVLDFTNPGAAEWYKSVNRELMEKYGVDGFKMDAGDAFFYDNFNDVTYAPCDANTQSELWALAGLEYKYNEFRASWKCGNQPLVQRLCDKQHAWDTSGLGALLPSALAQGLIGAPYTCPDMIGGGAYLNFHNQSDRLDNELFVRYAQAAALMPMMQFSAAPWRFLDKRHNELCLDAARLHAQFSDRILSLVQTSAQTGEPIVRCMDYVFPEQGLETINDQFMLGDTVLVAPVLTKGATQRTVILPKGKWRMRGGQIYDGGALVTVPAPLDCLPYFELM